MTNHILIVADGRSPTTHSWIENIQSLGYQVSLVSTFPCQPPDGLLTFDILPIAMSQFSTHSSTGSTPLTANSQTSKQGFIRKFSIHFQRLRYYIGPLTLPWFAPSYNKIIKQLQPDLVHALRIPFEGMLGSYTPKEIPFITSTWGNDLTLHTTGSALMRVFTRRCLRRADGLTSDTFRDIRLAKEWGLSVEAPTLMVPGSGGLDLKAIKAAGPFNAAHYNIPTGVEWVINPRGMRPGSVHQDVFFASITEVLKEHPKAHFICPGLEGVQQAQDFVIKYGIEKNTHLLPKLPQSDLWSLMKSAQVFVSPSSHDGTPNALLEAMACGCFPVAGDIESLREWIEPEVNGLLVNPHSSQALAQAICLSLNDKTLRNNAAAKNQQIANQRASKINTLPKINAFYHLFLK